MITNKINPYAGVYKRAVELYNSGYYAEAFAKFNMIIGNDFENTMANYYVAECYFNGNGVEKNYELAFQNYSISAATKHVESMYKLAYCYEFGLGIHKDSILMIGHYTQAAKSGHKLSQYRLGLCYKNGNGVDTSLSIAAAYFLNAAKGGIVDAQREAGICYEILNQPKASATLFLAAAEQNDPYSCYKIGTFFEKGYGHEPKYELAMHFYITAATLGNEDAILVIAEKYKTGNGLEKSIINALKWWNKVIETSAVAQIEVAICYLNGTGVNQNVERGKSLLLKAANQKSVEACIILAELEKDNVTEDGNKPYLNWLLKAAELNSPEAMYLLGKYHEENENIKECYRWYSMAVLNDYEPAIQAIKKYKKTILGGIKIR